MKKIRQIFIATLFMVAVVVFFESTKKQPAPHTECGVTSIECDTTIPHISQFDTSGVIKKAIELAHEGERLEVISKLEGKKLWGIDISKYQTNINWPLMVKKNKPDFVFVKATEGVTIRDKMYRNHKKNLEKHDILHGAYHFWSFRSNGTLQAKRFIKYAKLGKGNLAPVVDVEFPRGRMPSKRKVVRELKRFCSVIEKHYGVKPIIYTQPRLYQDFLRTNFSDYPMWFASYSRSPKYSWDIWQHTERARLYGYRGRLDKNVMNSSRESLTKLLML